MGSCLSRSESPPKTEEAAKETNEQAKNETPDSKPNNQKTANGQIDANHADEETTQKLATPADGTSTADTKTESTEKQTKSTKEAKTVRITETKSGEAIAEQPKSDEPVPSTKPDDIDIDVSDPAVHKAATTIQAGFRGHQTRKQLSSQGKNQAGTNDIDIDLNDPEVNKAAVKIQSSFRGHLTRKNMQNK